MRVLLLLAGIASMVSLASNSLRCRAADGVRPNIIFLMADDQCRYSMGCYGTPGAKTPHLDKLARDGIVFDRHYDTTAICMASRANVMTGLFEYRNGCNFDHGPLLQEHWDRSYCIQLRKAGYQVAFAGKFGFEVATAPGRKGRLPESDFDRWGGGPGQTSYVTRENASMVEYADAFPHSTRAYGAFGSDFIRDAVQSDAPFCLSISFKAPHRPVQPDPLFDDVYTGTTLTKPDNFGRAAGTHFSWQSRRGRQYERFHSWGYADDYQRVMKLYYQQIYAIDVAVGMIRDALDKQGVADNTVIIYTSDNGFLCGSHGYGSKVLPYEEASGVPLIMFDPRHPNSGRRLRCDALTGNVDFAPTIMAYAGLSPDTAIDGRSLVPLYDDPTASHHESLPLINVWGPAAVHSLAVVTERWKYIYWPHETETRPASEELYDLKRDPLELVELSENEESADDLAEMQRRYDQLVADWKRDAVPYHDYTAFGTIFDRDLDWAEKSPLVANSDQ